MKVPRYFLSKTVGAEAMEAVLGAPLEVKRLLVLFCLPPPSPPPPAGKDFLGAMRGA